MNDKKVHLLNHTDVDGLHERLPFGSRHYQEVQQSQAVHTAMARWHLLSDVRRAGLRRGERGR